MAGSDLYREHPLAFVAVRAFADRAGAERALLLLDRGDDVAPLIIEAVAGALSVQDGAKEFDVPEDEFAAGGPLSDAEVPDGIAAIRPAAPGSSVHVHPSTGEISAPLGAVAQMAESVRALVAPFGGRSVATADFPTHDPNRPLTVAAREGEPVVVAIGDQHFALP